MISYCISIVNLCYVYKIYLSYSHTYRKCIYAYDPKPDKKKTTFGINTFGAFSFI